MSKKNKKGFTLIELVAVLVIMAIIALIVTPLVMNIIRKARISADKRSVDAYGRSVELAIANYLLDNGGFPTEISQLTIEYSGDRVECSTTQLNSDSSIYLAGCTVSGRSVDYTYGKEETVTYNAYTVGDEVSYNNVAYRVIKASGTDESTVTLLKANPLTVAEVNQYGAGHINKYTSNSVGTAYDLKSDGTVGGMAYYTSETCGYINNNWVYDGCTTDYAQSDIKYVVDSWKTAQAPSATEARLITFDEVSSLGFELVDNGSAVFLQRTENTPTWVYNRNYEYWTMSQYNDSAVDVSVVSNVGSLTHYGVHSGNGFGTVRPVITIKKSALNE